METHLLKQKIFDAAAAAPLIIWFGLGALGSSTKITRMAETSTNAIDIFVQLANIFFSLIAITLILIRRPAVGKAQGLAPKLAGFAGCVTPLFIPLLPHRMLSDAASNFLSAVSLIGIVACIYVMAWLGRSFSILPQARALVTEGPYRLVRHPLYLAEFLVIFSNAFELALPWSLLIIAMAVVSQIWRMHYEEGILCETFPAYRDYMRHTSRLIPGLY